MLNEANDCPTHVHLQNRISTIFRRRNIAHVLELRLPNGKIADIAYTSKDRILHIIECKIDFRPCHLTEARYHYGDFCHFLWVAIPANQEWPPNPSLPGMRFSGPDDLIGLVSVDREGLGMVRSAKQRFPRPDDHGDAWQAFTAKLTAGEQTSELKIATGAERPNNNEAGHMDRPRLF